MNKNSFVSVIKETKKFDDFYKQLCQLSNELKGEYFERFAKYYLLNENRLNIKQYHRIQELPIYLERELLISSRDIGIDAVIQWENNEWTAVQVKFVHDTTKAIPYKKLSTFTSTSFCVSDRFSSAILFTNSYKCDNTLKNAARKIRVILGSNFERLPETFFKEIEKSITINLVASLQTNSLNLLISNFKLESNFYQEICEKTKEETEEELEEFSLKIQSEKEKAVKLKILDKFKYNRTNVN